MYAPELHEVVKPAGAVVAPENKHRILVHARYVAESLVRRVAQSLHLKYVEHHREEREEGRGTSRKGDKNDVSTN